MSDYTHQEHTITSTSTRTEGTHTRMTATGNSRLIDAAVAGVTAWQRIRERTLSAAKWLHTTISAAGWCAIVSVAGALVVGLALHWAEVIAIGIASLALLALALGFMLGRHAYAVTTDLQDMRVVVGDEIVGTVTVRNKSKRFVLPGRVDIPVGTGVIEVRVPLLRGGASYTAHVKLPTRQRSVLEVGPVKTVRADPIGLLRAENSWSDHFKLFVHPITNVFSTTTIGFLRDLDGSPSATVVDQDISFHAIREYQPGDSPRHIHWRSTAKTGTLMVRQYEETRRSRIALILGVHPDEFGSDDEFELAISALGSLGISAIYDHRDISVVKGAELPEFVANQVVRIDTKSPELPRVLLDDLSAMNMSSGAGRLGAVAELAARSLDDISVAFLFVGSVLSISDLTRLALKLPLATEVVLVRAAPLERPGVKHIGDTSIATIAVPDDFRHLMMRGVGRR